MLYPCANAQSGVQASEQGLEAAGMNGSSPRLLRRLRPPRNDSRDVIAGYYRSMETPRWQPGDTVVVRYPPAERMARAYRELSRDPVVNIAGWPYIVLRDTDDVVALYLPEGTKLWRWDIEEQRLREPRVTQGDSVRLLFPGQQ